MFFVVLDSRTDTYYNQSTGEWVSSLVCATFFDFHTQADESVSAFPNKNLITLSEVEDLSTARIDLHVDIMLDM